MGKISKNELNTSLATKIEEIDLKANISDLETTNSQMAQKAIKGTPTEVVINTGFASDWSGEIKYRKSEFNKVFLFVNLTKSTDITNIDSVVYTLPIGVRPPSLQIGYCALLTTGGNLISNGSLIVNPSGQVKLLFYPSQTLATARVIQGATAEFYV